jgi:hypothetical protein
MKTQLFVVLGLALVGAVTLQATSSAEDFIKFKDMELHHKLDWFDHMKRLHDTKFDLLKGQVKDWVAYSTQNTRDWQNNTDCSEENKEEIFNNHLNQAIALHKKHNGQWKQHCQRLHEEALDLQRKHEKQLSEAIAEFNRSK